MLVILNRFNNSKRFEKMVAVIDYNMGNLGSVMNAFAKLVKSSISF